MTVFLNKQRSRWSYEFQLNGKRYRGYADNPETGAPATGKRQAERYEALIRAAAEAEQTKRAQPQFIGGGFSVAQAFAAFAARKQGGANWPNQQVYIRDLLAFFGATSSVADITEQRVWDYIAWARQQPVMVYVGGGRTRETFAKIRRDFPYRPSKSGRMRADSTINRYLDCLRETLRIAYRVRDASGQPLLSGEPPKVPDLTEPEKLPRPIADDVLWEMVDRAPAHLAWGILLARLMGFRKGEMFALTCHQVDTVNRGIWLNAENTKARRDEFIPANVDAMELLTYLIAEAKARNSAFLITYRRRLKDGPDGVPRFTAAVPIKNPKRAWQKVLSDMGLKGLHKFHNTKASFVTAVAHTASAAVTQELARHKDYRTTQRYLKINDQAARAAVEAATLKVSAKPGTARSPQQESPTRGEGMAETATNSLKNMVGATGFEPATPSPPD